MARFNADYWEIPTGSQYLENLSAERALWFETEEDRRRRHAMSDFYRSVMPTVQALIDSKLTDRQREILRLYYFSNKTQEDIADELQLSQSTVSRHLFGTTRNGKKVGGAIPKLQKVIDRCCGSGPISEALTALRSNLQNVA